MNLADNSISDLHGLASLTQLEVLDVSNNCISSCETLEPLVALPQLYNLNLAGNAVCSCIGYPAIIFSYIPTLQHLDGLSRDQLLWADPNAAVGVDTRNQKRQNLSAALDLRSKVHNGTCVSKAPDYLQAQVSAMEDAFDLQEKCLSGNAAAKIGHPSSSMTTTVSQQIPYLKILQLWRHQAHHSMTQLCAARRTIRDQTAKFKTERSLCADAVRDAQLNALSWKERTLAADQKAIAAEVKFVDARNALEAECQRSRDLETETLAARKSLLSVRFYLSRSVSQVQEHTVGALLTVKNATAKLDAQKARIAAAAERVAFAAALVAQREVQLRNSIAMQALSHNHDGDTQNVGDMPRSESSRAASSTNNISKPESMLRPEAEALLSSLFSSLDPKNGGLVSRELLLLCISEPAEGSAQLSDMNSLVTLVKDVLGQSKWTNAVEGLRSLESSELTWGEFLRLLVCPSQVAQGAPLDDDEHTELARAGVWGDVQWGIIPLDLKYAQRDLIDKAKLSITEAEVFRLASERACLLKTIQGLARSMQKRAEVCKAHYLRETLAINLQNSRLQDQVTTLRDTYEATTRRHEEAVQSHTSQKERLEDKLQAMESELKALRDSERERSAYELKRADNTVLVEKSKYQQLEQEYDLMQQEITRKEILNKGLQRDARRAATSLSSVIEEKEKLEGELAACERQLSVISKEHKSQLEKLQKESEVVLDELRAQLDTSEKLRQETKEVIVDTGERAGENGIYPISHGSTNDSVEDDVLLGVRSEMEEIRNLKKNDFGGGQSGIYTSHLEKLLRLAEDAIGH